MKTLTFVSDKNHTIPKGMYKVGGFVRDLLMGLEPSDIDFVAVGFSFEELDAKYPLVGKGFPVFLDHKGNEIAMARTERKIGPGYNGFETHVNNVKLHEDLMRRDLTINAMAMLNDTTVYDPFQGKKDFDNKILRHVSEAFAEDPLRVLRLARFKAKYPEFEIANETKALALALKPELYSLTKESVLKETKKALKTKKPSLYFETLKDIGVLDAVYPSIFAMIGVMQNPLFHAEGDVFDHTMLVLDSVAETTTCELSRMAALFHDIGKPVAMEEEGSFNLHGDLDFLEETLSAEKDRLKLGNKEFKAIGMVVSCHIPFMANVRNKNKTILRMFNKKTFPKNLEDFNVLKAASLGDLKGHLKCTLVSETAVARNATQEEIQEAKVKGFVETTDGLRFVFGENAEFLNDFEKYCSKIEALYTFKPNTVQYIQDFEKEKNRKAQPEQIKNFINHQRLAFLKRFEDGLQ